MSFPSLKVELSLANPGVISPSWQDVTEYVTQLSVKRGRVYELDQIQAGTCSMTLDNNDRRFDPSYSLGPYFGGLGPMNRIRVSATADGASSLTVSGNEVTDAVRAADLLLGTGASGNMCDGLTADSSFGIRRAATNLFRRGQCDATTDWNTTGTGVISRATDATVVAPFSPQSLKYTVDGSASLQGARPATATAQAAAAAVVGAGSVYVKGVVGQSYDVWLRWTNTDASVTDGTHTVVVATGAWQLVSPATIAVAVGKTGDELCVMVRTSTARAESFWAAHAMLEKGQSVVAPYVATSGGATATHSAGQVSAPGSLLDKTQGWIAMRVRMGYASSAAKTVRAFWFAVDDSGSQRISGTFASDGSVQLNCNGGATQTLMAATGNWNAGDIITLICAWDATTLKISRNGSVFATAVRSQIPTGTMLLNIASRPTLGSEPIDSDVLWTACGTGTLTDTDAATIHARLNITGKSDPGTTTLNNDLSAPAATMAWAADTTATLIPTTNYLFTGFVERWPPAFSRPQWNTVSITATDAFLPLAQATISGTFTSKATGARINDVFTAASWAVSVPAVGYWTLGTSALGSTAKLSYNIPTTVLDTGRVTLPAITFAANTGQGALAHIQDVVGNTERGVFFIDGQGRPVFHDRYHRLQLVTPSVTLSDATTASTSTSIRYADITPSMDADHVANDITVTASATTNSSEVTDAASIDRYFRRTLSLSAQLATDAEALNLGRLLLRQTKDAMLRFDSVTLEPWTDDNQWPHALGREISDRVSVSLTPPSTPDVTAQAIAQECHIEAIEHTISPPLTWQTVFQLSPRPADFWVLGSSALGTGTAVAA